MKPRSRIVAGALLLVSMMTSPATLGGYGESLPPRVPSASWAVLMDIPLSSPISGGLILGAVLDDGAPF